MKHDPARDPIPFNPETDPTELQEIIMDYLEWDVAYRKYMLREAPPIGWKRYENRIVAVEVLRALNYLRSCAESKK